jgi:hypothetical protein
VQAFRGFTIIPSTSKKFKVNLLSFVDAVRAESLVLASAALERLSTRFLQTLLLHFYDQPPDRFATKNSYKQRMSLFDDPPPAKAQPKQLRSAPISSPPIEPQAARPVLKKSKPNTKTKSTSRTAEHDEPIISNEIVPRPELQLSAKEVDQIVSAKVESVKKELTSAIEAIHAATTSSLKHIVESQAKFSSEVHDLLHRQEKTFSDRLKNLTESWESKVEAKLTQDDQLNHQRAEPVKRRPEKRHIEEDCEDEPLENPRKRTTEEKKSKLDPTEELQKLVALQQQLLNSKSSLQYSSPVPPAHASSFQTHLGQYRLPDPTFPLYGQVPHFPPGFVQTQFPQAQYSLLDSPEPRLLQSPAQKQQKIQALFSALQKSLFDQ